MVCQNPKTTGVNIIEFARRPQESKNIITKAGICGNDDAIKELIKGLTILGKKKLKKFQELVTKNKLIKKNFILCNKLRKKLFCESQSYDNLRNSTLMKRESVYIKHAKLFLALTKAITNELSKHELGFD